MSRSDRGGFFKIVTAVFALIILCLSIVAIFDIGHSTGLKRSEQQRNSAHYAATADKDIEERCLLLDPSPMAKCVREIIEATNEHDRSEQDLVAQSEMSLWALGMLVISGLGLLATIIGVIYVRSTLLETRRIGQAQVRAYLKIEAKAQKLEAGKPAIIDVIVFNAGQTPALNVALSAHLIIEKSGFDWSKTATASPYGEAPTQILHPTGDFSSQAHMRPARPLAQKEIDEIRAGRIALFGRVFVAYEDVFKERREVVMYFWFAGEFCFSTGFVMMSPNGNYDGERRK